MSLLSFQIFAVVTIFLMAVVGGLLPIQLSEKHKRFLALGDAWASGIFLGAALFHMLPDAEEAFEKVYPMLHYPVISLICLIGFLLLLFIEQIILHITRPEQFENSKITGLLLLIILSIHALVEGGAIGINIYMADVLAIYFAVIAHKGSASFALAVNLRRTPLSTKTIVMMIIAFSLMSPLGIAIATFTAKFLAMKSGLIAEAIFNAFAAGTFLYIGLRHLLEKQHAEFAPANRLKEFIAVLLGVALMAVVAIWV